MKLNLKACRCYYIQEKGLSISVFFSDQEDTQDITFIVFVTISDKLFLGVFEDDFHDLGWVCAFSWGNDVGCSCLL